MKKIFALLILPSLLITACHFPKKNNNGYTITWLNDNQDILEIDEHVKKGETPVYNGEEPVKEDDDYHYIWTGWSPEIHEVNNDETYVATFEKELIEVDNRLTTPKNEKVSKTNHNQISELTYNSYNAFTKKFVSLMFKVNNSLDPDNLAISIPDAYLCLAITGIISVEEAKNDVLSFLELNNEKELRVVVKELLSTLCTLFENSEGKLMGGYNLNSIWLNPDVVRLIKDKDIELYQDLEEIYDASIYLEGLTSEKANQYLKDNGLKDLPTPEIKLDDTPDALNVMSVYYCLDYFEGGAKEYYYQQFKSGKHKMPYISNKDNIEVDYIEKEGINVVYEGDNFVGSNMNINQLNMDFFLPNDKDALPDKIFNDVLENNYHLKEGKISDLSTGETYSTNEFYVDIKAPYFSLDNESTLESSDLNPYLPIITRHGAGLRLVETITGEDLYLSYIKQFSKMKFNYDGFYSCSVTISGEKATSAMTDQYEKFDLTLDHPYMFKVNKSIRVNEQRKNIPIVIGEIITPEYVD